MFELMLIVAGLIAIAGAIIAFDGSRDVFHPLVFIGPMLAFLYCWMPFQLLRVNALATFFDTDQLHFVQTLNILGVLAFVVGCLSAGVRVRKIRLDGPKQLTERGRHRLLIGAAICGSLGLLCWGITIHNVGGFVRAFSSAYQGGWDDSGYVRDGSLLLLVGVLFSITALSSGGSRLVSIALGLTFGLPWAASALFMGRRGPTFALAIMLLMGWYLNRGKRPPLVTFGLGGLCLGWLVLFLVTNRSSLYIGSDFNVKSDVSSIVDKPDTGNEYIYGSGTVLSAERRDHYFWMRRYLAQIMVRPIPSAIWPTKYEDFGVPELLYNAGTGEGFGDTLGWQGAPGSAPGIVADLWVELWWLSVAAMGVIGWTYGKIWRKAVTQGGVWSAQYAVISCLSLYLVMQTMEAVIFRTVLLSVPCWITWRWIESKGRNRVRRRRYLLTPKPRLAHVRTAPAAARMPLPPGLGTSQRSATILSGVRDA